MTENAYHLDSLTLNAVLAALDERSVRLARELAALLDQPLLPTRDFAIDCVRDAIRDTERARLAFARQIPEGRLEDLPDEVDAAKRYADWTESERAWGQR